MVEKLLGAMGIQALLSVMLVGTCCLLWATAQAVPNDLIVLTGVIVAHWMGRKGVESGMEKSQGGPVAPVYIPEEPATPVGFKRG